MSNPERIALFIDGANLYASAKSLGFDIDYKRLLKEFQGKGRLIRAFYYTALNFFTGQLRKANLLEMKKIGAFGKIKCEPATIGFNIILFICYLTSQYFSG